MSRPRSRGRLWGLAGGVSRLRPRGRLGGLAGGGCIPACTKADTPPQQTATAAGGTHPTGMHSCLGVYFVFD